MSKFNTVRGPHYRWKKARGKTDLRPLPTSVYELIENSPEKSLQVEAIHKNLVPAADTNPKKTAVWTAIRVLCDKGLVEVVPIGDGISAAAAAPRAGSTANWACPATASVALENRILVFLQSEAVARARPNPALKISDICFGLGQIQAGVDRTIPASRYEFALVTLCRQGCARKCSNGNTFQASTV
jgi:hypothetical protein